jgi:hypothetical protein
MSGYELGDSFVVQKDLFIVPELPKEIAEKIIETYTKKKEEKI